MTQSLSKPQLVATLLTSMTGMVIFNTMPLLIGEAQSHFGWGEQDLGLLASSYLAAYALVALISVFWLPRFSWKRLSAGATVLAIVSCWLLSISTTKEHAFMAIALLGLANGIVTPVSYAIVSNSSEADRVFGLKLAAELLSGSIFSGLLSIWILSTYGFTGIMALYACAYLIPSLCYRLIPRDYNQLGMNLQTEQKMPSLFKANALGWLAMFALFLEVAAMGGLWTFADVIGNTQGIEDSIRGSAFSFAMLSGLTGALCAVWLASKLGNIRPMIISHIFLVIATVLVFSSNQIIFFAGVCLLQGAWIFCNSYHFNWVAISDHSGRLVGMIPGVMALGVGIGPLLLSTPLENGRLILAGTIVVSIVLLTSVVIVIGARQHSRRSSYQ
ncbi:MAG: MFS transporter [Pseudomonadales bacterium]